MCVLLTRAHSTGPCFDSRISVDHYPTTTQEVIVATGPVTLVSFPGLPASAGFFLQKDSLKKGEYDSSSKCSNPKCPGGHRNLATYSDDHLLFGNRYCWSVTMLVSYAFKGGLVVFDRRGRKVPEDRLLGVFVRNGLMPAPAKLAS